MTRILNNGKIKNSKSLNQIQTKWKEFKKIEVLGQF